MIPGTLVLVALLAQATPCAKCHASTHREWATSRHASAYTNPSFQVAFAWAQKDPWCLDCHGPVPSAVEQGVTCSVCHVRDGVVLSARAPSALSEKAHRMRHEPLLSSSSFCARCHEFTFPKEGVRPVEYTTAPLQQTFSEWDTSAAKAKGLSCQACHMEEGSHRFPGARDAPLLKRAIHVDVAPSPDGARIVATATGVGHRFPTGDPFRALVVEVCADAACDAVLATRRFARVFVNGADGPRTRSDTRLPAPVGDDLVARVEVEVPLRSEERGRWFWRAQYQLTDPLLDRWLPEEEKRVFVGSGEVGAERAVEKRSR